MRKAFLVVVCVSAVIAAASTASAGVIAGNFCSVAQINDFPAGVNETPWWNDLTDPAGFGANSFDPPNTVDGTDPDFKYADETDIPDAVSLEWNAANGSQNTNDDIARPADVPTGHDQMFAGYLQSGKAQSGPAVTFEGAGLSAAFGADAYDIYLYSDGDGDIEGAGKATFRIWASEADYLAGDPALQTVYGQDDGSDYPTSAHTPANVLADYAPITSTDPSNPTAGNYVVFSGLQLDTFYVRIDGEASLHGAALNGFEIVPEPATMSLLAIGGLVGLLRKKRRN
jgi:hypothetical protein